MRTEVRDKWVNALRSDSYIQSFDTLRDETYPNRVCVLGVLCDLAVQEGVIEDFDESIGGVGYIPDKVEQWADIPRDLQNLVVTLNDDYHLAFGDFATYIERYDNDHQLLEALQEVVQTLPSVWSVDEEDLDEE